MLTAKTLVAVALIALVVLAFAFSPNGDQKPDAAVKKEVPPGAKSLVVGAGCFWCIETLFEDLKGVYDVESGYAGGAKEKVTYEEVCSGTTGHAEVVKVTYDPKVISPEDMLKLFFVAHNPTTLNRQGPDEGTQYRSSIFYATPEEKVLAERVLDEVTKAKIWKDPIVTTIEPLKNYSRAEEYHQDYFAKYEKASPAKRLTMNSGYCAAIIQPKVIEFRKKYADRLKKKS